MPTRQSEVLRAREAAARAHSELNIDPDRPVDVFAAIRRAGLWLVFNEFDDLLGAMSREGAGGIMVNSARPHGMQRFTAAHELGHWYLHPGSVVFDTDEEMMRDQSLKEIAAQEFATAFLMPRRLLNRTLRKLGVPRGGSISPLVAYGLSRNLGVSYEAALMQLERIRVITRPQRQELAEIRPAIIKSSLVGGRRVEPDAHVWTPAVEELATLEVTVGDEISVYLPENRTTGYRWDVGGDPAQLRVVSDDFIRGPSDGIGSPGERHFVFSADAIGRWERELPLRRATDPKPQRETALQLRALVRLSPERENAWIVTAPDGQLS